MKHTHQNRVGLRPAPGTRWKVALKSLAMAAMRVHNYRNLHRAMYYEALCQHDCGDCE